jgi:mRNA interferase MazF
MERGEVWRADLKPTKGSEQGGEKERPVVIVSVQRLSRRLEIRVIVPLTTWRPKHEKQDWKIRIEPTEENGLENTSAADPVHVRSVSTERLKQKLGRITDDQLEEVVAAVIDLIGG